MSQTWTTDVYGLNHVGTTDLTNMKANFATLKSSFSGAASPATEVGQLWFDTAKNLLMVRGNSAFHGILQGNASSKFWIYSNTALTGWAIDAAVADVVLSLKGGSAVYNAAGGTQAGTWTQPNHTHTITTELGGSHIHKIRDYQGHGYSDKVYNISGALINVTQAIGLLDNYYNIDIEKGSNPGGSDDDVYRYPHTEDWYSTTPVTPVTGASNPTHTHTATSDGSATVNTHRPLAAIGTLQYPDVA